LQEANEAQNVTKEKGSVGISYLVQMKGLIGIAGNIGAGKTTLTDWLAARLKWDPHYESVSDNPFLEDFYADMHRWAFHLQIYFLQSRYKAHLSVMEGTRGVVQDRTIWEDVEIFARNLYQMGHLSEREWLSYSALFHNMCQFLKKPDVLIYLRASLPTLQKRIKMRGRAYEQSIDPNYLVQLNDLYEGWISRIKDVPVIVVESDYLDIHTDKAKMKQLMEAVESELARRQLTLSLGHMPATDL
jgi:deoxyadenosine/deoxycytidine kinase